MKFYLNHRSDVGSFLSQPATFIFNDSIHLLLQSKKGWTIFDFIDSTTGRIYARISFNINSHEAHSPLQAPFGSIELYHRMSEIHLKEFLENVQSELITRAVNKVVIRNFPDEYDEIFSRQIHRVMRSLQFTYHEEISSIVRVDERTFDKKIKISERQKLKKATELFQFEQTQATELKNIYSFIADCRKERNQSLSMTLPELKKTISLLSDTFYFFKVSKNEEIAAAAIVIKVSKKILYTFYYAHARKHNRVSPVVYLISGIYDFARRNKFKMIDLGTSMIDGHINHSLLHFKKSIGGISTGKFTYTKTI